MINLKNLTYHDRAEYWNTLTHALGATLALIAGAFLLSRAYLAQVSPKAMLALVIYITGLCGFLLASACYHGLIHSRYRKLLQFFDHSGIYLMIIASYTPYTWLVLPSHLGWPIWWSIVGLALLGLTYDRFFVGRWPLVSVIIYVVMGWFILIALPDLHQLLSPEAFYLLLAGGITYTLGALFYLSPKLPYAHVYWHIMVVLAAALMYSSILITLF